MTDTSQGTTPHPPETGMPPLDRVRQEMERWMDIARSAGERAMETLGTMMASKPSVPPIDILEIDADLIVLVDLPGVAAESVKLSMVGNMLAVEGTRTVAVFPEVLRRHTIERSPARFERSIPLPTAVDPDQIKAETRDGLLTVTLRKLSSSPGRSIPVGRGGGSKPVEGH